MTAKESLLQQCHDFVMERERSIMEVIREIQLSLESETKSSAGDKHETGRAMMQLEREKAGQQLLEINGLKEVLSRIDTKNVSDRIALGSIVYTTRHNYFIAISAGEFKLGNDTFYAISVKTPIAQVLMGNQMDAELTFRNEKFRVTKLI